MILGRQKCPRPASSAVPPSCRKAELEADDAWRVLGEMGAENQTREPPAIVTLWQSNLETENHLF